MEEGVQLGVEEVAGDEGQEIGEGGTEGEEGLDGIGGAAVDGVGHAGEGLGQPVRFAGELSGQAMEMGAGDGMGKLTGLEGVEVAPGRTAPAGSQLGVAVGPAAGLAAHGPVAAAGGLAAGFVRVSGHDALSCPLLYHECAGLSDGRGTFLKFGLVSSFPATARMAQTIGAGDTPPPPPLWIHIQFSRIL